MTWKRIPDSQVRHVWERDCICDIELEELDRPNHRAEEITVSPDSYQDVGIPNCPECGDDYIYVRTEVLQPQRQYPKETTADDD